RGNTLRLGRTTWCRGLICRLPHFEKNLPLRKMLFGDRIYASVAIEILLSTSAFVLWKIGILCAFQGLWRGISRRSSGYSLWTSAVWRAYDQTTDYVLTQSYNVV